MVIRACPRELCSVYGAIEDSLEAVRATQLSKVGRANPPGRPEESQVLQHASNLAT